MVADRSVVPHSVMQGMGRLRLAGCSCVIAVLQSDGKTSLHYASEGGHLECVQLLLDRGTGVDVVSVSSWLAMRTDRVV